MTGLRNLKYTGNWGDESKVLIIGWFKEIGSGIRMLCKM